MTPQYNTPELELLKEIDRKQDKLIERLFGDLDIENPKARLPALEARITENALANEANGKRIRGLENDRIRLFSIGSVLGAIGGFLAELFIHGKF